MQQPTQTDKHSNKIDLSSLPNEILAQIFINLNGDDLFSASHVCQTFSTVTEIAFERKYSNEMFWVNNHKSEGFYRVMLTKFDDKISKISIGSGMPMAIFNLAEQKCSNLHTINFATFITNNPELEKLHFAGRANIHSVQSIAQAKVFGMGGTFRWCFNISEDLTAFIGEITLAVWRWWGFVTHNSSHRLHCLKKNTNHW